MYLYLKAIHIVFVVTWFAGLFYMPRLLIYNTEAGEQPEASAAVLRPQFQVMIRRLWYGITWPSAILTLVLGCSTWWMLGILPSWLVLKLFFVAGLYGYHISLQVLVSQQLKGQFRYSSQQLRIWNELATVFLVAIVLLVVVKEKLSVVWGMAGLLGLILLLLAAIRIYQLLRRRQPPGQ
jgi:protoporphyrinogen IX oxidase